MPLFAGWLASAFGWIWGLFAAWLSVRAAFIASIVAVSLALVLAVFLVVKGLITGLVGVVPYEPLVMGFWACWPSNAETCIAAAFGCDIAVFIYRWKVDLLGLLAKQS
jgi:hypothetical protein